MAVTSADLCIFRAGPSANVAARSLLHCKGAFDY
jgi:hypothetical protein